MIFNFDGEEDLMNHSLGSLDYVGSKELKGNLSHMKNEKLKKNLRHGLGEADTN